MNYAVFSNKEAEVSMFKKHKKLKISITIFLVFVMVLSAGSYILINGRLSKLNYKAIDKSAKATGIDENIYAPDSKLDKDFINILLLGVDTRDEAKEKGRSDSNIILTIDKKHKKIKMTSILRDTIMDMTGHGVYIIVYVILVIMDKLYSVFVF